MTLCDYPTLVQSTVTSTSIAHTWGAVTGASSYRLAWRIQGGTWAYIDGVTSGYTKTGLVADTTYEFYGATLNAQGLVGAGGLLSTVITSAAADTNSTNCTNWIKCI